MTQKLVPYLYLEAISTPAIETTTPINISTTTIATSNTTVISTAATILTQSYLSKYFSIFGEVIGVLLLVIVSFMFGLCFYWVYRHRKDAKKSFKRNEQSIMAQNNIDYANLLRKKQPHSIEQTNNSKTGVCSRQKTSVSNTTENTGFNIEINNKMFRLSKGCEKFLHNPNDPRSFGDHLMHCHPDIFQESSTFFPLPTLLDNN